MCSLYQDFFIFYFFLGCHTSPYGASINSPFVTLLLSCVSLRRTRNVLKIWRALPKRDATHYVTARHHKEHNGDEGCSGRLYDIIAIIVSLYWLPMHKAKWTPRQIPYNGICLGVHFALCIIKSSTTRSYWALFLGRWSPFLLILYWLPTSISLFPSEFLWIKTAESYTQLQWFTFTHPRSCCWHDNQTRPTTATTTRKYISPWQPDTQCCQVPVFVRISTEIRSVFRSTETQRSNPQNWKNQNEIHFSSNRRFNRFAWWSKTGMSDPVATCGVAEESEKRH